MENEDDKEFFEGWVLWRLKSRQQKHEARPAAGYSFGFMRQKSKAMGRKGL
jgi:hypothetical protein